MALTEAERVAIKRHLGMNSAAQANYPWIDTFFSVGQVMDTLGAGTFRTLRLRPAFVRLRRAFRRASGGFSYRIGRLRG